MGSKLNTLEAKELSKLLISAREKLGLTQLQVAEKGGIHVQTYAGFEQGRLNPSWSKLYPVFKVLKIKLTS